MEKKLIVITSLTLILGIYFAITNTTPSTNSNLTLLNLRFSPAQAGEVIPIYDVNEYNCTSRPGTGISCSSGDEEPICSPSDC